MRSHLIPAAVAAVLLAAPAAAQDFSITNTAPPPGGDWSRQLQAWWDMHAYYPPDAPEKNESGSVRMHLSIHPDGEVWQTDIVQGLGVQNIDIAANILERL